AEMRGTARPWLLSHRHSEWLVMIIVLRPNSTPAEIDHVIERIKELGLKPHLSQGEHRTIIGVIGDESKMQAQPLQAIAGVEQVLPIMKPFKLASREFNKKDTVVSVGKVKIGGGHLAMIAGPCAIDGREILSQMAGDVNKAGEYVLSEGNPDVVLCERGVRSFEDSTRNMLDMSAVPNVKGMSHLPIIVDPSHATGRPDLIPSMALASVAAGADGVHIEVHSCPE